ncbi:MAG: TonB-dependent receptor [Woeseiaceae bacterium]|nr:TonB-dependent receptor [Woeseiaceae bacterium]
MNEGKFRATLPLVMGLVFCYTGAMAQQAVEDSLDDAAANADEEVAIDEVVVTGRFISSSQRLVNERMNDAFAADLLGEDTISRLGDSTVGEALRRMPGLTLVADKFIYIRGLGERYSATSLNGAQIPSPDLTRNVIPLDVFPTSVVESLRVQKSWDPSLPANFGGGAVDIRAKGIPDGFVASIEFGGGFNSEASGTGLTYPGGGDDKFGTDDGTRALSADLLNAIDTFQGDIGVQSLLTMLRRQDPSATLADAQAINRSLALELNRNIVPQQKDLAPDVGVRASIGNSWQLGDDWEFGTLVGGSYQTDWRKTIARARNFNFPDERTDTEVETTESVTMAGTASFGLKFTEDHTVETTTLWLRNTDDETAVTDFFNENREKSDGLGWRGYRFQFEEREMLTNQVSGTHYLGDATRDRLPFLKMLIGWLPTETEISWFVSDSDSQTDIPNQFEVASQTTTDPETGAVLNEAVTLSSQAADFRFTELDDEVQNYGWAATLPVNWGNNFIEFSGGWQHARKARTYYQAQFSLGPLLVSDTDTLGLPLNEVFSEENILDPANNFVFNRQGANNESYIAATMTDAVFGAVDWTWNDTWRIAAGARWEDYRQAAVNWNPFGYSEADPQVTTDPDELAEGTFSTDEIYPAAAITYMSEFWAETFQLRFGWSETAVRPDLREITSSSYIDPITGDLTRGNPGVVPSDVTNYDIRAEWFFGNGDNLTVTLFKKDIAKPIEFFESPASDTTIAREILNANEATVEGVEFEFLKTLGFMGRVFEPLFLQGNLTVQDSELVCDANDPAFPCEANAPTNPIRPLSGASEYVANLMVGFDSDNSKHTASLIYNVFGERLYVAGRNGAPDGYEQPFHSLDFTYFWYPTDTMTLKLKAQNLLRETFTIEREGVTVFEEDPGTTVSLSFTWAL